MADGGGDAGDDERGPQLGYTKRLDKGVEGVEMLTEISLTNISWERPSFSDFPCLGLLSLHALRQASFFDAMIPGGLYNFLSPSSTSHFAPSATPNPPPLVPTPPTPPSPFTQLLEAAQLPPPGPEYFAARRALWRTRTVPPKDPTPATVKLEALLEQPGALESDQIWSAGLNKIWRGLVGGGRLKNLLPLRTVIKILFAGWRKDGTWPEGTAIVDDDNFFGTNSPDFRQMMLSSELSRGAMSDVSSVSQEDGTLGGLAGSSSTV